MNKRPWYCPKFLWRAINRRTYLIEQTLLNFKCHIDNQRWTMDAIYTSKSFEEMAPYNPMNVIQDMSLLQDWYYG